MRKALTLAAGMMALAGTAQAAQDWAIGERTDPQTGALTILGRLDSLGPLQCSGEPASLYIGCDDFGMTVAIRHGCDRPGGQNLVSVSPDRGDEIRKPWGDDGEWFTPRFDTTDMVRDVLAADRTAMWWDVGPYDEVAVFATGPAHASFRPVAESCGWVR